MRAAVLLLALATMPLSACALQPVYAGGGDGAVASGLSGIEVSPIEGQSGWLMRDALIERLGASGAVPTRYRLDVRLDNRLEGLGLLKNDTIGRERRTLRARYRLVDVATGAVMLDTTSGSDAGVDVVSSEYATIAAEQTALENLTQVVADRIVATLALKLRDQSREAER
ncbi:LPS assembly lipoprotein LptE [Croceicoccus hydrothermalis]|uniref:LPS assembly lipoprotein LptE n=1 Tax=Croceicoccus hydrothermalis TaxID=2867964 RepID=UPI001EFB4C46|nr:LPS assembly lipoprotein LptE [Croceicoccus hydrothermalis]